MDDGNKGCLIFTVIVVLLIIISKVVSSLDGGSSYSHEYRTNSKYKRMWTALPILMEYLHQKLIQKLNLLQADIDFAQKNAQA